MRTTVDIDERVLKRARKAAEQSGRTLGAVVTDALKSFLAARPAPRRARVTLPTAGKPGDPFPTPERIREIELEEDLAALGLKPLAPP